MLCLDHAASLESFSDQSRKVQAIDVASQKPVPGMISIGLWTRWIRMGAEQRQKAGRYRISLARRVLLLCIDYTLKECCR